MKRHLPGMAVGLALGLLSNAFAFALGEGEAFVYRGILLAGIAWVYFGFAVADGRRSAIAIQAIAALVFFNVAFIGAREESELLLGLGFLAHAGWDWLHHDGHGPTAVRSWYPPFCVVADVVIAIPLLI
jgi:hypothetical protein